MSTDQSDVVLDTSGGKVVTPVAGWTVVHAPTSATQAIATKAAGAAGVKHVCTGIVASIAAATTAQTPITVQLLDGASVLLSAQLAAPANQCATLQLTDIQIEGTAATSMTLQFTGAGVTASVENVTLIGFDVAA